MYFTYFLTVKSSSLQGNTNIYFSNGLKGKVKNVPGSQGYTLVLNSPVPIYTSGGERHCESKVFSQTNTTQWSQRRLKPRQHYRESSAIY